MPVAFDASVTANSGGVAVTSLTTGSFTISSGANRAAFVGLFGDGQAFSGESVSLGGVNAVAVSGAVVLLQNFYAGKGYGVTAPPSGAQTATASWTSGAVSAFLNVLTATGVDQTTPLTNGTSVDSGLAQTSSSLAVTSVSGDLTATYERDDVENGAGVSTNQTREITAGMGSADVGSGNGTTTHTWTETDATTRNFGIIGANFKAVATGPPFVATPLPVDHRPFPFAPGCPLPWR